MVRKAEQILLSSSTKTMSKRKKTNKKAQEIAQNQVIKTQLEAAEYCQVNERTIRRWKDAGMPLTTEGWYIKSVLDYFKNANSSNLSDDKQRSIKWDADLKELKVKKLEKELQNIEAEFEGRIGEELVKRVKVMKKVMMAGPRNIAPKLVGKTENKIIELLTAEYSHYMNVFAGERRDG